jgi:uncharacterized NAD(P)/FAD-binding protein YdhS
VRSPRGRIETIAIIGGGASGVLTAAHLARRARQPLEILLIEPTGVLGGGAAYSTQDPRHVLNAPARVMSAFEEEQGHFTGWLAVRDYPYTGDDFAPRSLYRTYLQDVFREAHSHSCVTTSIIKDRVLDMEVDRDADDGGLILRLCFGGIRRADRAVLAVGAPGPATLTSLGLARGPRIVTDPWQPGSLHDIPPQEDVLIVGTGLTMVDVVLALSDGRVSVLHARSRHGLLPAVHNAEGFDKWSGLDLSGARCGSEVFRRVRRSVREAEEFGWGWRNVVSAAREQSPLMWAGLPHDEKVRLLRHAGRLWDVHRHRMPSSVSAAIGDAVEGRRLTVGSGRLISVEPLPAKPRSRFVATVVDRSKQERLEVGAVIDCTGPSNLTAGRHALFERLVRRGMARPHATGRGLSVLASGVVMGPSFEGRSLLYSIGWARSGECFESSAIPDLRKQAAGLAVSLCDAPPSGNPQTDRSFGDALRPGRPLQGGLTR